MAIVTSMLMHLSCFLEFVSKSRYDPKKFRGVSIDDLTLVEGIVERNIFIYDFDIQK